MQAVYSNRGYSLRDHGQVLGSMEYPSLFSSKANITTGSGSLVLACSGWSGIKITQQGRTPGFIKPSWRHCMIQVDQGSRIRTFYLRMRGFWKNYFVLEDEHTMEVARLNSCFKWKTFGWDFAVEPTGAPTPQAEIILLAIHAARTLLSRAAAA